MADIGDYYKLTLFYTGPNASVAQSVFYFQLTTVAITDLVLMDTLEDWVTDYWGADWSELATEDCTLESMAVDQMNLDGTVAQNVGARDLLIAGQQTIAETLPAAVSAYLLAQTVYPKQRGSKYVPLLSESMAADGEWTATAISYLSTMVVAYLADITATGGGVLSPGLISRTLVEFVPFLAQGLVNSIPAYQRRRKPSIGS